MTGGHPRELLTGYVLGDLEWQELELVETHLLECASCRAEVARLHDALYSLAEELPPATLPKDSWERLRKRQPAPAPPQRPARSRAIQWPLAAGLALLVTVGGYAAWRELSPPSLQAQVEQWKRQGAVQLALRTRQGEEFGTLLVRADEQCLVVLNKRPPPGQVYQVWGRQERGPNAGVPISLGLTDGLIVQVYYGEFDSMGVSLEPVGGSARPTHPLGRVNLPKS